MYLIVAVMNFPCGALLKPRVRIIRVAVHLQCDLIFPERGANNSAELHPALVVGSGVPILNII